MDTSKTYIKMCDCNEIQADHKLKRYEATGDPYDVTGQTYNSDHYWAGDIWLPRQDQLQEMILHFGHGHNNGGILVGLSLFSQEHGYNETSMEQLWLAFVMKEKHNKTWNKNEWVG